MALTTGVLKEIICNSDPSNLPQEPVVQVLGVKKLQNSGAGGADRYRLVLSDGENYYTSAMLGTQINDTVNPDGVEVRAVIKLDNYTCNVIQATRKIIIILDLTVLQKANDVPGKIGEPTQLSDQISQQPAMKENNAPVNNRNQQSMQQKPQANNSSRPQMGSKNPYGGGGAGYGGGGATSGSKTVFPIASLTPYQNKWTVRVRVTNKSAPRTWSNSRGEGKLFSMDLLDESGEIRATMFNEQMDKYYDMIEKGKVYYITKGTLKTANKQYNNLKNDYEMTINNDSIIEPCNDAVDLPQLQFHFVNISDLESVNKDALVDILGVVKSAADITQITTRQTNKQVSKRDLTILDRSGTTVSATIWGAEAESFEKYVGQNVIVAIKGAKVSDFGGRSLSILNSSIFNVNPDIPEAHTLRGWYDNSGKDVDTKSISGQRMEGTGGVYKTINQIKDEQLGMGEKPDYFNVRATAVFFKKDNCMYQACPSADCNKKVSEENGNFRCEKCDRTYPDFQYRMILSSNIADFSGNQWITSFQESAEAILGVPAEKLGHLKDTDEAAFDKVFQDATFKQFIIKIRAKYETYQDETRLKCSAVSATPLDFKAEARRLEAEIKRLEGL